MTMSTSTPTSRGWLGSLVLVAAVALATAACGGSSPESALPDTTAPLIATTTPADGSTAVPRNSGLVITFNEPMARASLVVDILPVVALGAPAWSNDSTQATLQVPGLLDHATDYSVGIIASDVAGNALAGATVFGFRTANPPDTTPPTVVHDPPDGATGQPIGVHLSFTFSEPMNRPSVEGALTIIPTPAGVCLWSWSGDSTFARCDLTQDLGNATSYGVTMGAGATDLAGNALIPAPFSFTTEAAPVPPTVLSTSPASGATGVLPAANVSVTFSERMDQSATAGAFQVTSPNGLNGGVFTWSGDGRTLTYDLPADVAAGTLVTFSIGTGARDLDPAPLSLQAPYTSTFRVAYLKTVTIYPEWDGDILGASTVNATATTMRAGDTSANVQVMSAISFAHALITPTPVRIRSATLAVYQSACTGTPFDDLDACKRLICGPVICTCLCQVGQDCNWDLQAKWVDLGATLDVADFSAAVLSTKELSPDAALGWKTLDVLDDVLASRAASLTRSQWRLEFPVTTDADGVSDSCTYSTSEAASGRPYLTVTFDHP